MVDETWQIPPPRPSTSSPFTYTPASLNPAAIVLSPTILLYEKVSPGSNTVPFIFSAASLKFVLLFFLEGFFSYHVCCNFWINGF